MSIQDDIFDVRDALKKLPEKKAFERIENYLYAIEHDHDQISTVLRDIKDGANALKHLLEIK